MRFLLMLLISVMTPGAVELSENLIHWLWQGHGAHEMAEGDHHGPIDEEHGCTPSQHFCSCHASLSFMPIPAPKAFEPSRLTPLYPSYLLPVSSRPPRTIDRPPRA